ncbi:MAG: DUF1983 domain-containing protein [Sulfurimonas sp.]|nr:DUF1983 domain-containing protein [Sulfurimonas sp.]
MKWLDRNMPIKYSISNVAHSSSGLIQMHGTNSHALVPVGAVSSFEERFNNNWTTNIVTYRTSADIAADIAAAEQRVNNILNGYTTTTDLASYVDNNIGASVVQTLGSYVTRNGDAASMYSLNVIAGDIAAGFEIGALSDSASQTSYFKIMADAFAVYGQAYVNGIPEVDANGDPVYSSPLDAFGNPIPTFSITKVGSEYQSTFNGKVVFENLLNQNGTTVIDGGRIKTEFIDIGQPPGQSGSVAKHIGEYPDGASASMYPGTINDGDSYYNTTDGNIYIWNDVAWVSTAGKGIVAGFAFKQQALQPATPSGGSFNSLLPDPLDGWSDGVPADDGSGNPLWYINKWFTSNGSLPQTPSPLWAVPRIMSDKSDTNWQWNTSASQPGLPGPNGTDFGWTNSSANAVWTAISIRKVDGNWVDWTVARIKGEDGTNGSAGERGTVTTSVDYQITTQSQANGIIASVTGGAAPKNGDTIWHTSVASGTRKAFFSTSWALNTVLHVHGDAIVAGTLHAEDIIAGGTITGAKIQGAAAFFDDSQGGFGGGYALAAKSDISLFILLDGTTNFTVMAVSTLHASISVGLDVSGGKIDATWGIITRGLDHGIRASTQNVNNQWGVLTYDKTYSQEGYFPFTGSHFCFIDEASTIGDICISTDAYSNGVSQAYPYCSIAVKSKDKRVVGIISTQNQELYDFMLDLDTFAYEHYDIATKQKIRTMLTNENEQMFQKLNLNYEIGSINSVGEGMVNVCSIGGDIESGDYITSSIVKGKGMKQDDDILHNYTVAKALSDTIWSSETVGDNGCYLSSGSDGVQYKTKMVACTYHCG